MSRKRKLLFIGVQLLGVGICYECALGVTTIRKVSINANGANNGSSWPDAYTDLQSALSWASDTSDCPNGDQCHCTLANSCQIWVAHGTYKPSYPHSFQLQSYVKIYGGFAGTENFLTERTLDSDPYTIDDRTDSVLSGDLNGDDPIVEPCEPQTCNSFNQACCDAGGSNCAIECCKLGGDWVTLTPDPNTGLCPNRYPYLPTACTECRSKDAGAFLLTRNGENSQHVVLLSDDFGNPENSVLDGFTIYGGYEPGTAGDSGGGGIRIDGSGSAEFRNCNIIGNFARGGGGGVYSPASPNGSHFVNCVIAYNKAGHGGGYAGKGHPPHFIYNSEIVANQAYDDGGGLNFSEGDSIPHIVNTLIARNVAGVSGGGSGGGIFLNDAGGVQLSLRLENCTIAFNQAIGGAGGGLEVEIPSSATVANSIVYFNAASSGLAQINGLSAVTIAYSNVQDVTGGTGNISIEPKFITNAAKGLDNKWGTSDDTAGNMQLQSSSPCIDAGSNVDVIADEVDVDQDGNTTTQKVPLDLTMRFRFINAPAADTGVTAPGYPNIVDMGTYEAVECSQDSDCVDTHNCTTTCDTNNGVCLWPDPVDCDNNGVPDWCEIASGEKEDCNSNLIPDECESPAIPSPPTADPAGVAMNRNISFSVEDAGGEVAIRVTLVTLMQPNPPNLPSNPPPNFSAFQGEYRWVGAVTQCKELETPLTNFKCAPLLCTPHYENFYQSTGGNVLYVFGAEIVPSSLYNVKIFSNACEGDEENCTTKSCQLPISTQRWGDVISPFQLRWKYCKEDGANCREDSDCSSGNGPCTYHELTQPNVGDISEIVDKFMSVATAPIVARADLVPNVPNNVVNISDVGACVDAFKNTAYVLAGPCTCPSTATCPALDACNRCH